MQPAVTMMRQALDTVRPVVTAMEAAVKAEQQALTAMQSEKQGDIAADGLQRDLAPNGDVMLRGFEQVGTEGEFFNQLKGVPIDYLIATPLISASRANLAMAGVLTEFIDEVGFKDGQTRLIKFKLTRPVKNMANTAAQLTTQEIEVQAPVLALVPLPALLIDTVNVDLTVEIVQKTFQKVTDKRHVDLKVGAGWGAFTANFTGNYSLDKEATRDTNQTAKYTVRVVARQQQTPEGMSKLMDVFHSTIEPIEIGGQTATPPPPPPGGGTLPPPPGGRTG